ncbi:MAG: XdhC family protein [Bacteroidales bacterium]
MNFFNDISETINNNIAAVLCIIIGAEGSTPRKPGSKMLVFADGSIKGTIGGGSIEKEAIELARNMIGTDAPSVQSFNLANDLEMHCGGRMTVYFEPLLQQPELIIFGAGHVGKALAKLASISGFKITVADNREGICATWPQGLATTYEMPFEEAAEKIKFHSNSYIVVTTYKHSFDSEVVAMLIDKPHKYIGMIGSVRKVDTARKRFSEEFNMPSNKINSIDMPIGIDIACETPEEIAVSILAKLIDVKNKNNR